ncbi:nicotinate-nucleotide adenylyltransferase [Desulfonauticus submarinus]|uniref:Probable nicotinate-nucleotide adenylyltransferase n=1 Tax=Desulfonauticus submarinus TaxID=206665 RepID=A0A1H0CEW7_9BACT|nr:nicotinate (nicotinamide) nucleotide adenylyltransferase [Desulfonauticus submarinus]SDN56366.1 nicotinate-nucleotide adenylyltransferase [Desulfonauticus submarinus]
MKIGILGGSFNPVHIGHLRLGIECLEQFDLDRVWFMPAFIPPHKVREGLLPFELRFKLLVEATKNTSNLEVIDLEQKLGGISYTVRTLKYLKTEYSNRDFYFILGDIDFISLPSWYQGNMLINYANLIVVRRKEIALRQIQETSEIYLRAKRIDNYSWSKNDNKIFLLNCLNIYISSSEIRKKFLTKRNINFLVPREVEILLNKYKIIAEKCWQKDIFK